MPPQRFSRNKVLPEKDSMLIDGSMRVNRLDSTTNHQVSKILSTRLAALLFFQEKERGCDKTCSRAISEGTQNAWTEQRGQAAILAGKR